MSATSGPQAPQVAALPFPALETARLRLREVTEDDAEALFRIHSDQAHMKWFGADPLQSLEQARDLVHLFAGWRRQANPGTRWGIEWRSRPGLIGTCGLFAWNRNWRKCSLGYEVAASESGQGVMTEALCALLAWGFEEMALNRVEAQVHEANAPSRALLARLGFAQEGRLRQAGYWNGQHHDLLILSLLRDEWCQDSVACEPRLR